MDAREKNISKLYKARAAHLKWVNQIKLLISGVDIDKKEIPPVVQDSEVGKWFYNDALQYAQFSSSQTAIEEMEVLLESIFNSYSEIYAIFYSDRQKGGIAGFWKNKTHLNKHQVDLASKYYEDIVKLSDQLKVKFKVLERQLYALPNERHELISGFDDIPEEPSTYDTEIVASKKLEEEVAEVYSLRAR